MDQLTAGELVRTSRTRRNYSQRELAERAGVPQSTVSKIESGRQQPSVAMLTRLVAAAGFRIRADLVNDIRPSRLLERHRETVLKVLADYPVREAWVFGSAARGDDTPDSDIDLLVDLDSGATFADYVGLSDDLMEALGCPVDVVTTKELESNDLFRRRVLRERRGLSRAA